MLWNYGRLVKAVYGRFDQVVKICKRHPFPLFAKKTRKLKNQSPRCPSFSQIMKVENFIFSPFRLVTQPCSFFVGLSLLQRWKVSLLELNYCWLSLPLWEKNVRDGETNVNDWLFSDDNLSLLMTDTFSSLLFPKLFCPKKLSLVAKNRYRPFFHVWDWSILPLLENELYKRVFNVPFTSGQYFDLSEKMIACHITWRIGKLSCVPNFDSVPSSLPKPF